MRDGQRRSGKGVLRDRLANDGEGARELLLLIVEGGLRRCELWRWRVQRPSAAMGRKRNL